MKESYFVAGMALVGLVLGLGASQLVNVEPDQNNECDAIADEIRSNQTFNGTLACYSPEEFNSNLNESEEVVNQTDLQCVCRRLYQGDEQIFTIRKSR